MKIPRVYIENSVIGGYFDEEFQKPTRKLFDLFRKGNYKAVISAHTIYELDKGAPDNVKENLKTIDYEENAVTQEMYDLTEKYVSVNIREGYNTLEIRTPQEVLGNE